MKYTTEIDIKAPIEKVAELMGDHEQMIEWMKELNSYKIISGKPKEVGTKTKLQINLGKDMEVTETVLAINFPNRFKTRYEMSHGSLLVESHLKAIDKNITRYSLDHEFQFGGLLKLTAGLMKPAFVKHSERMMKDFKNLAEK